MGKIITVDFRQDTLFAVERDDGVFVAVKPIVQTLGLDWKAQHRRMSDDAILSQGMVAMTIPSVGGAQETTCLRLDLVNGWLFTIEDSRIRDPEVRDRVLTYKRECYGVLFAHFYGRAGRIAESEVFPPDVQPPPKPFHLWTPAEINSQCRVAEAYGRTKGSEASFAYMMHSGFPPLAVLFKGRPIPGQMTLPYTEWGEDAPGGHEG